MLINIKLLERVKMFVKIDNIDMDAFKVEEWINRTRDANGGVITPEFAMEILGKTNHFAHIKKVINLIKKNCSDKNGELVADKVLEYKDFILSSVDGREMSPQTLDKLNELAGLCGCLDEVEKINKKYKYYDAKACEKNVTVSSQEELEALTGTDLDVLFVQEKEDEYDRYEIKDVDFAGIRNLRFNELANIHIYGGENFPKDMDFSNCYAIVISHAEFNGDENIKWASLSDMNTVRNIPASTDLSKCRSVKLDYCKFCEDGELKLGGVCNLDYVSFPKKVDFSRCDEIYSEFRNGLYGVEEIKFKNKAQKRDLIYKLGEFENKVVYEDVEKNDSFADKFMNLFGRGM